MVYHKLDCSEIQFINRNNLAACGSNPEGKGFKPCSICRPVPKVIKIENKIYDTWSEEEKEIALRLANEFRDQFAAGVNKL